MNAMVIVGGGQCGARAAYALRDNGWRGTITLIAEENDLPYERPALSKSVLTKQTDASACTLYGEAFYRANEIDVITGTVAAAVDRTRQAVKLGNGQDVCYARLLLTTGAEPRKLTVPGSTLSGIHTLRTTGDAARIATALLPARRLLVVGAGFIGLEVASSAIQMGCTVTVLEAAPRALARSVPAHTAESIVDLQRSMGVNLRFNAKVVRFRGRDHVSGVELEGGEVISCDAVVVGVGVTPRAQLAADCGLEVDDGIVTDATLSTSDNHIFAAGDVCSFHHPLFDRRIRLESWKNAEEQARVAARNMLGLGDLCSAIPWFWSDQYNMTVQVAGLPNLGTSTMIRETGPRSQIIFSLSPEDVVVGASGFGPNGEIAKDVRIAQDLIARQIPVSPAALKDRSVKLRSMLKAEA